MVPHAPDRGANRAAGTDYFRIDMPRDLPHHGRRNEMHFNVTEAVRKDPTHCEGEIFG